MPVAPELVRRLLEYGAMAPSGDNMQPWTASSEEDGLCLSVDPNRDQSLYNFEGRASLIALGAMVENIAIAGRHLGVAVRATSVDRTADRFSTRLTLQAAKSEVEPLFDAIAKRCTNRKPYRVTPIGPDVRERLLAAVRTEAGAAELHLVTDRPAMRIIARAASLNDRLLFELQPLHHHFFGTVRWTPDEAATTRDGLFVETLELGPMAPSFKASRRWSVARLSHLVGASRLAPLHSFRTFLRSSLFALVQVEAGSTGAYVAGGRAAQRLWLTATALGLSVQPMMGMLCLRPYLDPEGSITVGASARQLISRADRAFRQVLPLSTQKLPILLVRLGYADPPTAVSLRRGVETFRTSLQTLD